MCVWPSSALDFNVESVLATSCKKCLGLVASNSVQLLCIFQMAYLFRLLGPPLLPALSDICPSPKKHGQKVRPYNLYSIGLGPFRFLISKCGWVCRMPQWMPSSPTDISRTLKDSQSQRLLAVFDRTEPCVVRRYIWCLWPHVQKNEEGCIIWNSYVRFLD